MLYVAIILKWILERQRGVVEQCENENGLKVLCLIPTQGNKLLLLRRPCKF